MQPAGPPRPGSPQGRNPRRRRRRRRSRPGSLQHVVVTAGAEGAALAEPSGNTLAVPGFPVQVADTVGAGDTFTGALAVALAAGVPARDAVRAATAAAATAVTRSGAQDALPRPADIAAATGLTWPAR